MSDPLSRRLWAVQWKKTGRIGDASVHMFRTEEERQRWVEHVANLREPVAESHPLVQQYRERMGT